MKFSLIQKKSNYLNENEESDNPNAYSNELFDSTILKNRSFLDRPGKIKYAKKHASADRPLHKIKEFTKETDFCHCCNLPCETKGVIEPFKMCDSIDKFSECGVGLSLYFYFILYSIIYLAIILLMLSVPFSIFNKYYSNELSSACNLNKFNDTICQKYIDDSELYSNTFLISIQFSSDSLYDYKYFALQNTGSDINVKKTIIKYGLLNFLCTIVLFLVNIYLLILLKQKIKIEKAINCFPSDFTLFLTNLNNALDYYEDYCISKKKVIYSNKEKFKDFVNFLKTKIIYNKKKSKDIYDINFCYKLKDFMKSEKNVEKNNYKLLQIINNSKQKKLNEKYGLYGEKRKYFDLFCGCNCKKGISIKRLLKDREINQRKINFLLKNSQVLTKNNFAGAVFLTFNTIEQKEEYYSLYPHYIIDKIILYAKESKYYLCWCWINETSKKKFFRRKSIKIYIPPEPEDVIWENIEYDMWFRIIRGLLVYLVTLFLLFLSFVIVLLLTIFKEYLIKNRLSSGFFIKYGTSLLITATISGINEIFYYLLENLTKLEKQISMSNYYLSFSIKLTFFTFVSSGIVPLVSNLIENGTGNNEFLVDNMIVIFLCNSFLSPILWAFDVQFIYRRILIFFIERKKDPDKSHNMSQRELNKLYQKPSMKIPYKYSYFAKTLLLSLFYVTIFPFGVIISLVGFVLSYFLELVNFTHLYNRPEMINERICLFYMEYFVINLFIFNLGILLFMKMVFYSDVFVIINLIIFGILSLIPYTKIMNIKGFNLPNSFLKKINYEDVYFSFYNDYQRQNPITKKNGLKNYINKLRINGYISQKVYNFSYMNIDTINVMELYYRSKKNRNIFQTQQALANYNNAYRNSLQNKNRLSTKNPRQKRESNKNKENIIISSSVYDEQLTNLLKQSIYKQRFGSNLDDLNRILKNKNLFISNNTENSLNKNEQNCNEELESEGIIEKNKDYILKQYKYPFLLNISLNMGGAGDLGVLSDKKNIDDLRLLNGIKEEPEFKENKLDTEEDEIVRDKDYYGVDFDIYSRRSSSSNNENQNNNNNKKVVINIEMKDLSNRNNNKYKKRHNYEMSSYDEEKEEFNDDNLRKNEISNKNENINNKYNKNNEKNKELKKYFLNLTRNYDGDNDSDYDD